MLGADASPLCIDRLVHDMTYDLTQLFLSGNDIMLHRTSSDDGATRFYKVELDAGCNR